MGRLPRTRRLAAALAFAAMLLSLPGCSFALVKQHRPASTADTTPQAPAEPPQCTSSRAAPVVDTVLAVALLATAAVALSHTSDSCEGWGCLGNGLAAGAAVVTGVPGLAFAGSAWYGYRKTGACAAAKRAAVSEACDPGDPTCIRVPWPPARTAARALDDPSSPAWEAEGLR